MRLAHLSLRLPLVGLLIIVAVASSALADPIPILVKTLATTGSLPGHVSSPSGMLNSRALTGNWRPTSNSCTWITTKVHRQ